MPLSCMSMVVGGIEAWRTHGLVMAMYQTRLGVVSYRTTPNPNSLVGDEEEEISLERGEGREEGKKERKE